MSAQLPYGFYTRHLDRMTYAINSEYVYLVLKHEAILGSSVHLLCESPPLFHS